MAIILLIAILQVVAATEYYVSVEDGSDNNPGTLDKPWQHVQRAVSVLKPVCHSRSYLLCSSKYLFLFHEHIIVINYKSILEENYSIKHNINILRQYQYRAFCVIRSLKK